MRAGLNNSDSAACENLFVGCCKCLKHNGKVKEKDKN